MNFLLTRATQFLIHKSRELTLFCGWVTEMNTRSEILSYGSAVLVRI